MRFSERIGKRAPKDVIQVDSMDEDLRNGLWNVVLVQVLFKIRGKSDIYAISKQLPGFYLIMMSIWINFLKAPADDIPNHVGDAQERLKKLFFEWSYLDVYDFIDYLCQGKNSEYDAERLAQDFNVVLEKEVSAYRFINGQLAAITNVSEINSVEQAIQNADYKGASIHLAAALEKLSDRREPDYRNSIKESISAVESVCQAITGDAKATLGPALKKIEQKMPLHGALKEGLLKIYGYTSDSDGIRHALQDEPNLSQEDALFMLVTCSAFVNYLTVKADKAGAAGS
jgi:hypothetical protein